MSATTEKVRELLGTRITELDEEKARIQNAIAELGFKPNGSAPAPTRTKKRGRPRKRRSGTRIDQALGLIAERPGITASEIAAEMKIKPNYLYRVLTDLGKQKLVKKEGRKYSAA